MNLLERHKAGSPTDSKVYWVTLRPAEIALHVYEALAEKVSHGFVKRLLKSAGYRYRKARKSLATGLCTYRDEQFKIIFELVAVMSVKSPVLSIDCKKKERLGDLYRDGKVYTTGEIEVFDHDYSYLSKGNIVPHGIYDVGLNKGYMSIGTNYETAEFITDNLLWWWDNYGIHNYPDANKILILCDSGGANSYRHHVFKKQLLKLAREIGLDIIICHYPPYASKWNPIEHSLFCHVHRAIQGVIFSNYELVKQMIAKTSTTKGLTVEVRINTKKYSIGLKTNKEEVDFDRVQFNQNIPHLSYRISA